MLTSLSKMCNNVISYCSDSPGRKIKGSMLISLVCQKNSCGNADFCSLAIPKATHFHRQSVPDA